jgi:hypothetical protein
MHFFYKEIIMIRCNIDEDQLNEEWPSIRYECNRAGRTRASNDKIKEERRLKKQKLHRENEDSDDDYDIYQQNKKQRKWYTFTQLRVA